MSADAAKSEFDAAERSPISPERARLLEVSDIITAALMVRAGLVIDERVARERANNCAQALAHLIAGSGFES